MNFHQNIEQILAAATPEQKLLWNDIFLRFGERIAVSQLVLHGLTSLAPCSRLGVSTNVYYLAYQFDALAPNIPASINTINFYDFGAVQIGMIQDASAYWDVTAAALRYSNNSMKINNILFNYLSVSMHNYINFIGYQITY